MVPFHVPVRIHDTEEFGGYCCKSCFESSISSALVRLLQSPYASHEDDQAMHDSMKNVVPSAWVALYGNFLTVVQ